MTKSKLKPRIRKKNKRLKSSNKSRYNGDKFHFQIARYFYSRGVTALTGKTTEKYNKFKIEFENDSKDMVSDTEINESLRSFLHYKT